jgi:UDP:flavonoid glycosyltransferase YjiC (YdhE family)
MKKKKILFVGEGASLAHIVRPLILAKHLDPDHFEILFACSESYRWLVTKNALPFFPLPTITPSEFRRRLSKRQPLYDRKSLQQYIDSEYSLFKEVAPDMVVGDFRISLSISTELFHIPYIMIANAYWSPYSKIVKSVADHPVSKLTGRKIAQLLFNLIYPINSVLFHAKGFNLLREYYNLPAIPSLEGVYTEGEWTLYADIPSLAPTENLPPHNQYIGPILDMPDIPLPDWWGKWPTNKPVIYVCLGSTGDVAVLENIIKSLANLEVTVLLSTAERIPSRPWPANFFVASYLPGIQACQASDLVLYNGGAGSLYQALSCSKPILAFPSNMDQFLCSSLLEVKGAGKMLMATEATIKNIKTNVLTILKNSKYRECAQILAKEINQFDAIKNFTGFIDDWDQGKIKRRL